MDRISNLPEDVLCHVLSYLPTKQTASTPVLSKKWQNLWKHLPNLEIDDSVFLNPEQGKGERVEIRQSFVDFVDRVLASQGDSPIKKFSLKCITGIHPDIVNRWIRNVLSRGVSELDIYTDFSVKDMAETDYRLPEEIFVSKTLVKLKLGSDDNVDWWKYYGGGNLPMLKNLHVDADRFGCVNTKTFIPSFSVLEELRMRNMEWIVPDVTVTSPSLKRLTLYGTGVDGRKENPESFSFDTPNLVFLSYSDVVAQDYPLVNMKILLVAHIDFIVYEDQIKLIRAPNNNDEEDDDDEGEGDVVLNFGNVVKLLNGIQNVKQLSIGCDTLEVFSMCCDSMPVFNNVKKLGVTSEEGRGWQAMPVLLSKCPHVEIIILEGLLHHVTDKCGDACECIPREDRGRSLKSCPVKILEIQGFKGTMKEMRMIKHFLDYLPSLKLMKVYIHDKGGPTQLSNPEIAYLVCEMFELYNKVSSCNVQLLMSDYLCDKWTAQGQEFLKNTCPLGVVFIMPKLPL